MDIQDEMRKLGPTCRHFNGQRLHHGNGDGSPACAMGYPIRKIVRAANGGSIEGISYMYPCRPGPMRKANCPDYDPKLHSEVEAEHARWNQQMDKLLLVMRHVAGMKESMVAENTPRRMVDCPACGGLESLNVAVNISGNRHAQVHCAECNITFME